jgi:hypothetical protein
MRQRATMYCRWEIMFIVWTVYAFLFATAPTPSHPLAFYLYRISSAQIRPDYSTLEFFSHSYLNPLFYFFQSLDSTRRMIALCEEVSSTVLQFCDILNDNKTVCSTQLRWIEIK